MTNEVTVRFRVKDAVFEKRIPNNLSDVVSIGEALDTLYQYKIINAWEIKEDKETHYIYFPRGKVDKREKVRK